MQSYFWNKNKNLNITQKQNFFDKRIIGGRREGLYSYNDCVSVPPLSMCDDVASFSLCGVQSVVTNSIINAMIESKKLEFGPTKCYNLHIGKREKFCQKLKVHKEDMTEKQFETYLGDILSRDGKNDMNMEKRRNNGIGLSVRLCQL